MEAADAGREDPIGKEGRQEAFRWILLHLEDAKTFGADLEGTEWEVLGMILAIYFVLTFGWTGSPGEWMVWAWAAAVMGWLVCCACACA